MSTTAMWLLLAVVVIVIVFASVLYKRTFTVHELALTGVMAALSLVAYLFFRVPFYGGSSFHLGNTFTALTALLLDGVSGGLAGAIGLALADILAGDPGLCRHHLRPEVHHRHHLRCGRSQGVQAP